MKWLQIIFLCILAAVIFGVIHDQITARICIEYFTIGHHDIGTSNPTIVGLYWGVVATWWVGAGLGIVLAAVSRLGSWPKRDPASLIRPVAVVMITAGCFAAIAGVAGWIAASNRWVYLVGRIANEVPTHRHVPFLVDLWMHLASYATAAIGGLVVVIWVLLNRQRAQLQILLSENET